MVVGYRLYCLDEPVLIAVSKPLPTEFGIHHRLESCVDIFAIPKLQCSNVRTLYQLTP